MLLDYFHSQRLTITDKEIIKIFFFLEKKGTGNHFDYETSYFV